jgi:hypothetical protein
VLARGDKKLILEPYLQNLAPLSLQSPISDLDGQGESSIETLVTQLDRSVGKCPFISSLGFVHLKSISIISILSTTSARYESIYLCSEYVIYHWRWLEYTVIRLTVNELETIICCICTKMAVSENVVYVSNHGVGWQRDSRSRFIRSSAICPLNANFKIFVEKRTSCSIYMDVDRFVPGHVHDSACPVDGCM